MAEVLKFAPLLPELVLIGGAMLLLLYGVMRPETDREAETVGWLAIAVLAVSAAGSSLSATGTKSLFTGAFIDDPFARFMKLLALSAPAARCCCRSTTCATPRR